MFFAPDNYNTSIKPSKLRNNPTYRIFKTFKEINKGFCSKTREASIYKFTSLFHLLAFCS